MPEDTVKAPDHEKITSPMMLLQCIEEPGLSALKTKGIDPADRIQEIRDAIVRVWEGAREETKFDAAMCVSCWTVFWGAHPIKGCPSRLEENGTSCNPELPLWPIRYDVGIAIPKGDS